MIVNEIINTIIGFNGEYPSAILISEKIYDELIEELKNKIVYIYPSDNGVKLHIAGVQVYRTNDIETFKVI